MGYLFRMKFFIKTLGCPKNLVDSEVISGFIKNKKNSFVSTPCSADIVILNTCAFIKDAVRESLEEIENLSRFKGSLIVTGCLPQRFPYSVYKNCDYWVGLGKYEFWKSIADGYLPQSSVFVSTKNYISADGKRNLLTPPHYAYLRIAEGCSNKCSYCTIPYIRGIYRSKPIGDLIEEARFLRKCGVRELILIAQDTGAYGFDIYGEYRLKELIDQLSRIEGIEWIRLMYLHPAHLTDVLIDAIGGNEKIRYIDIPVQHISDSILSSMHRRVTSKRIKFLIKRLKDIPGLHIRSEVMVGYPGEGEKEFSELVDFLLTAKFDSLGLFKFSLEEGTPLYRKGCFERLVCSEEIEERYDIIQEIARQISYERNLSLVGRELRVIVDAPFEGRDDAFAPEIDGKVFFSGNADVGDFVDIKIERADDFDLYGILTIPQ